MLVSPFPQVMPGVRSVCRLNVKPGDRVVIVTSTDQFAVIPQALEIAATEAGASEVTTIIIPPPDSLGTLSGALGGALREADLAFCVTAASISYTRTLIEARKAGLRNISMNLSPQQLADGGALANYDEVRALTEKLAELVAQSEEGYLQGQNGTAIRFQLGRVPWQLYGVPLEVTGWEAAFPDGEVMVAPLEGTADGRYVVDTTILCLGNAKTRPIGLLKEPVTLEVEAGRVTEIHGGAEARQLEEILNGADENGRMIGEFGIGTNPSARLVGGHEDKKLLGTVHLALGDNHVFGGRLDSSIHIDLVMRAPTVTLDDRVIMRAGVLQL